MKSLLKILQKTVFPGLILILITCVYYFTNRSQKKISAIKELKIYVPFVFSESIDPKSVNTVGDQIISEHIFGYHFSVSEKKSQLALFSEIEIDKEKRIINIKVKRKIYDSKGFEFGTKQICNSIKSSFKGTQHTKYLSLIEGITCKENLIQIVMRSVPINIEYWLRSTDYAIAGIRDLPITKNNMPATTGPFSITKLDFDSVELKINKFFPSDLRSNRIEKVVFQSYKPTEIAKVSNLNDFDIAYMYGYSTEPKIIKNLKMRDYKLQIFPNEWLVYIGFQENVSFEDRNLIGSHLDSLKKTLEGYIHQGSISYSVAPSDRGFGLNEEEFQYHKSKPRLSKINRKLTIATLDEWASIPLFKQIIGSLKDKFKIEIKIFSRKDLQKIYSKGHADLYLSPMGISAADPLGNYSFLKSINKVFGKNMSEERLVELYKEENYLSFTKKVKSFEIEILKERRLVPIGHFPGIVVESKKVNRDEHKSWDWGIQAWAYIVN